MTTPPTRLYQCPGCWSWGMWPTPTDADGSLECECGERLTRVDLRDPEAAVRGGAPAALREAAADIASRMEARVVADDPPPFGVIQSWVGTLRAAVRLSENTVDSLDELDVERVKHAVVNIAKRHGVAKDPPPPNWSLMTLYGYSAAPAVMDGEIAAEYRRLTATAASDASEEGTND